MRGKLNNPFFCLLCKKKYIEKESDIHSTDINNYCRYLGYCHTDCWDKIPKQLQQNNKLLAHRNGSLLKVRHKFFLKKLPGYLEKDIPKKYISK